MLYHLISAQTTYNKFFFKDNKICLPLGNLQMKTR